MAFWPWLVALAFLLGSAATYLLQKVFRKRDQRATWAAAANRQLEEQTQPDVAELSTAGETPDIEATILTEVPEERNITVPIFFTPTEPEPDQHLAPPEEEFAALEPQLQVTQTTVGSLSLALAARRLSATLINTVLNYQLEVSNNGSDAIGPIHIGGDMISAHASLPTRSQLELTGQSIEPLHTLAVLAPGESTILEGELRLALSAITPIRSGNASLFVPLARFRIEAMRKGAPSLVLNHTSVIGESQHSPCSALKPFRLDLGPRLYSDISQRELALT